MDEEVTSQGWEVTSQREEEHQFKLDGLVYWILSRFSIRVVAALSNVWVVPEAAR